MDAYKLGITKLSALQITSIELHGYSVIYSGYCMAKSDSQTKLHVFTATDGDKRLHSGEGLTKEQAIAELYIKCVAPGHVKN